MPRHRAGCQRSPVTRQPGTAAQVRIFEVCDERFLQQSNRLKYTAMKEATGRSNAEGYLVESEANMCRTESYRLGAPAGA